ncbi:MAG: zinc dependent phospholipase C family protein [Eubacteriales bacterium]|nr:zinc dependent phospholipase C family protein [Eubacteriales bacterium]
MPAFVSHHHFADAALSQAQPYIAKAVSAAPMAFRWGAQGPDILFYHQPLVENRVSRTGHRIHVERVSRMFSALAAECARLNEPEATAYLLGFCCHYALDSAAHPFVTYISNYRLDPLYPQLSHGALHNLCEAELDRALLDKDQPGGSAAFRADLALSMDKKAVSAIGTLLSGAIWEVYGTRIPPKAVKSSMRSMLRILYLLHDKNGLRASAALWVENRLGSAGAVSSLIRPAQPLEADCANLSHQPWIDAQTPYMRHYTDYFQIFQQAQYSAANLMDVCYDAIQSGTSLPQTLFRLNYLGLEE